MNKNVKQINDKLFSMLEKGITPFHVVLDTVSQLETEGYKPLSMKDEWKLKKGGNYYINHNDSTIIAFHVGKSADKKAAFRMAAAHTDFPCLFVKPAPEVNTNGYGQVNIEIYGGAIYNTWFDRPLSLAGKVAVRSKDAFKPEIKFFDAKDKILYIPNLAIHMNREVNKGVEINAQTDMLPLIGMLKEKLEDKEFLLSYLAKKLGVKKEDILDYELFVYNPEKPEYVGMDKDFISAPRLDNITSCQALISGLIEGADEKNIHLIALFNHEEIGSGTKQGAGSLLLNHVIEKIAAALNYNEQERVSAIYNGILLSVDVAHATHPNKVGKMDITNKPVLNGGFCIKAACSQSYATDCEGIAIVKGLCDKAKIKYQRFENRSDVRGGGTLGSIASAHTPVKTVDIGIPMLAMHSAREFMGSEDEFALYSLVKAFFA